MKTHIIWLGLSALIQGASCHYTFAHLIVNDTITPKWKYVRDVLGDPIYRNELGEFAKTAPFFDIYSNDMRCGRDAGAGPKTSVATVIAGTEIGFKIATNISNGDVEITHEGPGQVYLSRAPNDDVKNYDGSGDWFKVAEHGVFNDSSWLLYHETEMRFVLPGTTPPGQYLMRIEQFAPSAKFNQTQWYVNCAQIEIVGAGGGSPGEMIKFPGGYDLFDYGIWITRAQENHERLLEYYPPGPYIWQG